jgi:hypothetical protein
LKEDAISAGLDRLDQKRAKDRRIMIAIYAIAALLFIAGLLLMAARAAYEAWSTDHALAANEYNEAVKHALMGWYFAHPSVSKVLISNLASLDPAVTSTPADLSKCSNFLVAYNALLDTQPPTLARVGLLRMRFNCDLRLHRSDLAYNDVLQMAPLQSQVPNADAAIYLMSAIQAAPIDRAVARRLYAKAKSIDPNLVAYWTRQPSRFMAPLRTL